VSILKTALVAIVAVMLAKFVFPMVPGLKSLAGYL